jgi:predicted amidohydrolase YtcJ
MKNKVFKIAVMLSAIITFGCTKKEIADMVVVHAKVITVDDKNPGAEAFAIKDDKFIAVGSSEEIKKYIGDKTKVIDAKEETITPGFNDAHMHPGPLYPEDHLLGKIDLTWPRVSTMDDLISILKKKAAITPKGIWIQGSRYNDAKLGRHPTKEDLDKVSTDHPIMITHSSGHLCVVNSYVLKAAGITKNTPNPPGGAFDREKNGEPNGICRESAEELVDIPGYQKPKVDDKEELDAFLQCFRNFTAKGITSIGDAGISPKKIKLYEKAYFAGQPVRINAMILSHYLNEAKSLEIDSSIPETNLKAKTIKVFHGNSLSGRTCWLKKPYEVINSLTGKKDYYGIPPARSQESLDSLFLAIHNAGFQIAVHSNGDREIPMVLTAMEKAIKSNPRTDPRHRIEHCSVVDDTIMNKIKEIGVVLALHSYEYEHGDQEEEYGSYRWNMMHPTALALKMGIPVAGTSDYSVSQAFPMLRIQSMVTRKGSNGKVYGEAQKVTVEDAIKVWTLGSAYATFEENIKGSIEKGKLADFVILSQDPRTIAPDSIMTIKVLKTVIGGKVVFEL